MAEGSDFAQEDERYGDDPLVQDVARYSELKNKLGPKVLEYILNEARATIDSNVANLIGLDVENPDEKNKFRKYQSEILAVREALTWLTAIIEDGEKAIHDITEEEGR